MPQDNETLFVIAEQTGQVVPVNFDAPEASVMLEERNVRLQNVVTLLAHKSMLEGFVSFDVPSTSSYGERASVVRENAKKQIEELTLESKMEFARATGHFSLLGADYDRSEVKRITRNMFSDFLKKYYGHRNYKTAQEFRRKLSKDVELYQSQPQEIETPKSPKEESLAVTELNNHEKLKAILNDERAGFLPTTNREKTYILTILDYIDSKRGTADQLLEVFKKSQGFISSKGIIRTAGVGEGRRSVESLIYELGDYAGDAIKSHSRLAELQNYLSEIYNPRLTLEAAIGQDHSGFAPLYRYNKLSELFDKQLPDILPRAIDPMKTVENRWAKVGEGKHKKVTDRFMIENPESEIVDSMNEFISNTSILEARHLLSRALINEEQRAKFFTDRLNEVRQLYDVSKIFGALVKVSEEIVGNNAKNS